jgi:protein subunit release factor A
MLHKSDIDVLVWWSDDFEERVAVAAVKLVHKPTGISAESDEYATQPQNYEAALLELERKVGAEAAKQ